MLTSFLYRKSKGLQISPSRAEMLASLSDKEALLWVDLEDPTDFESECLVEIFNFHPLAIEDCLSDHSQPKVDDYEEYLFVVMNAVGLKRDETKKTEELETKEVNFFLGKNYVVTFHKVPVRMIEQVRALVPKKPDLYLGHGADMLLHLLLDKLVDNYQPVLDMYDDVIDRMEDEIFKENSSNCVTQIMQIKRDIFSLRKIVSPQRDTINYLARVSTPFIKQKNRMYFRDIYDHLFRIYGIVEGFHEMVTGILQAYFSYSSHKLNAVMKRMTVLATVAMPALIIASIYGMNFEFMPELHTPYGYYFSIGLMALTSVIMLIVMKIKRWI